ncbi:MAG: NAD(P)-binding protein [Methylophilaceae bacterium]
MASISYMKKEKESHVIVVGGGVAGLLAALWVQACGHKVTLIERAKACGGLLRSVRNEHGYTFDCGTHIPSLTGHPVVDELMFGSGSDVDWINLPTLKKGNYFAGVLNSSSQFIDITKISKNDYLEVLSELINSLTTDHEAVNLSDALALNFGNTLTKKIFTPLLKKIYRHHSFEELDANAHRFLAYARIIVGSAEVSRELKKSPVYDAKFAFHEASDHKSASIHRYPKKNGTGAWVDVLVKQFVEKGGALLTDTEISSVVPNTGTLGLSNGNTLYFQHLIWTGPLGLLAKYLFSEVKVTRPDFVPTRLYHLTLSAKPLCDAYYVYINDPDAKSFRVTLYSNITGEDDDFRVTVETVAYDDTVDAQLILQELIQAKLFKEGSTLTSYSSEYLPNGFPAMTTKIQLENKGLRDQVAKFSNISIGGRGASESFFMNDVLNAIAKDLEGKFGLP